MEQFLINMIYLTILLFIITLTVYGIYQTIEDENFERRMYFECGELKNYYREEACYFATNNALDEALFWNNLAKIYLDAGLLHEANDCENRCVDILEAVTGYHYDRLPI